MWGVAPTPAIAYLTRKHKVDAGVVISASHNPMEFNGIKFFNGDGYKLSDQLEDEIEALIRNDMEDVVFRSDRESAGLSIGLILWMSILRLRKRRFR